MNKSTFKAYDIRGIYPTEINSGVAKTVAKACVKIFPEGEIIVAHDARHGSQELGEVVKEILEQKAGELSKKTTVRNAGMTSTPMFYFLVNHFKAVGGIMITASHNPKNYNGFKIVKTGAEMISGLDILKCITDNNLE